MTDNEYLSKIADETKEEWRQVKLDGELINYDISNFGRIRRHDDKFMLKPSKHKKMKNCYLFITLKKPDGRTLNTSIHRLVAMMFVDIGDKYKKKDLGFGDLTVDHLDGIRYHNLPENLEWVPQSVNAQRQFERNGHTCTVLSDKDVRIICTLLSNDAPFYEIADLFDISEAEVAGIRYGSVWKEISKDFEFPLRQLSKDKVIEIADYLMEGYSIDEIAKMTDVHRSSIERIKYKQSWADITKDYVFPLKQIKEEDAHIICKLLQEGKSTKYIHEKYGYSKSTIKHIRQGTRWTHVSKNYNIESNRYKVKDEVIEKICAMLAMKIPMTIISEKTSVSYGFVKCIKARKYRKDITDKYQW